MLRRIGLLNFKCFAQLDLPCAPLNLLCGLNGMGKSSVIQSLLVLRQSFRTGGLLEGRLILGGTLTDLGVGSEVVFEGKDDALVGFVLFGDATTGAAAPWAWAFEHAKTGDQLTAATRDEVERVLIAQGSPTAWRDVHLPSSTDFVASDAALERIGVPVPEDGKSRYPRAWVAREWRGVPPFGGLVVHVPAERVGPRKSYPLAEILARRGDFGASGEYAWNYLNDRQNEPLPTDDPRCVGAAGDRLIDVVDHWLQHVSPGAHLQLRAVFDVDAVVAEFTFDRVGDATQRRYRATNVGFGLSYVLPVVVGLLAPPGTLCLVENPEAHLHPHGQTQLAELAVRAAAAGVQVFAETHSDHFLDGVRLAVRGGLIAAEDTAVHYFERDGGRTIVSSPTVDSDGRLSHWPADFFDQHEKNLTRLLAPRK